MGSIAVLRSGMHMRRLDPMRALQCILAVGATASACSSGAPTPDAGEFGTGTVYIENYFDRGLLHGLAAATIPNRSNCQSTVQVAGCTFASNCTDPMPPPAAVTVGVISISGTASPIELLPTQGSGYVPVELSGPIFQAAAISIAVAAHPAVTIAAPSQEGIMSITPADPVQIDRSADYSLTWQPGGSGDLYLSFAEGIDETNGLTCHYPANAGEASVPMAALAMLGGSPRLYIYSQSATTVDVEGGTLTVAASSDAILSNGSAASLHVVFTP